MKKATRAYYTIGSKGQESCTAYNYINLIVPFYVDCPNVAIVTTKDWQIDNEMLGNKDSRFFSHIMDSFVKTIDFAPKKKKKKEEGKTRISSLFSNKSMALLKKNETSFSIDKIIKNYINNRRLDAHDNGPVINLKFQSSRIFLGHSYSGTTGFYIITIIPELKRDTVYSDQRIFEIKKKLKILSKDVRFRQFVFKEITSFLDVEQQEDKIKFFEDKESSSQSVNGDSRTIRTIMFSQFYLAPLSCNDREKVKWEHIIPLWFSGRSNLINQEFDEEKYAEEIIRLNNNGCMTCSEDGCSYVNLVDTNDEEEKDYFNTNAEHEYQHYFCCYLLSIHQYYFLRAFSMKVSQVATCKGEELFGCEGKRERTVLLHLEMQYALFKSIYTFEKVASAYKYQQVYEAIQKFLRIKQSYQEIHYILDPSYDVEKRYVDNGINSNTVLSGMMSLLTPATLLTAWVAIFATLYCCNVISEKIVYICCPIVVGITGLFYAMKKTLIKLFSKRSKK